MVERGRQHEADQDKMNQPRATRNGGLGEHGIQGLDSEAAGQRSRNTVETAAYREPTIEKAVQCLQILPAGREKPQEKSFNARGSNHHQSHAADDEDDHSQNETKSQITQFTDNTGTNNPSQQFQMNQVRVFQKMNAELLSQPNLSEKSPVVDGQRSHHNVDESAAEHENRFRKCDSAARPDQEAEHMQTSILNAAMAQRTALDARDQIDEPQM